MVNQQLIADRLKLSRATVSRCFTNHPGINPVTRAKVFSLAAKLGYTHLETRAQARGDRRPDRIDLGVLICVDLPDFKLTGYGNPGQELLNGLSELARIADARLDLHFVQPNDLHAQGPAYAKIFSRRKQWNGVVLIYPFPRAVVDELLRHYPCVSLVEQYSGAPLNCVDVDHYRGTEKIIDQLRSIGHERIGFFTWRYPVEASWALRRFSAYIGKLTSVGLPIRPEDIVNAGPRNEMSVADAHEYVLHQIRQGVTAWLCAADHQAYELIEFLLKRGVKIPEQVSITGFDGIPRPSNAPLLSTVQIPYHQIGLTGGKRLMDLLQKRFDPVQHILLDCDWRAGETVAPPPDKR
jgi:DNA-binding LacI/PurR family transcriptional regulator